MIGIDKGSTYTKTDKGLCIRSTIRKYREGEIFLHRDVNILEMDGQKWVIGEQGNYSTDLQKSQHYNTKALILLTIALTYPDQDYIATDIVTGLPIGLYSSQKQAMKDMLQNTYHKVNVNGKDIEILIRRVEIFPEAAGAFYSQFDYQNALIIDIGGISIDTALFKGKKLIKYSTYSMGVMKLYSKMINKINSEHDLSKTEWDMEELLTDGLTIYGQPVDLGVEDIAIEHCEKVLERLNLEYDLKSIPNVLLAGGSAAWIKKYFELEVPQIKVLAKSQSANAIGYGNIGKVMF